MKLRDVIVLLLLMVVVAHFFRNVHAQTPQPAPACEQQVSEQYRQLLADRVLQQDQQTLAQPWSQQLTILVSQLRVITTQFYDEIQQGLQTRGQKAVFQEQVRQLQQVNAQLKQELEALKNGGTPPSPPAN